jgi:hypothetical protein
MDIAKQIYIAIIEELKQRDVKLTDWLIEQDIIIPESIPTFDIDEIKPLGHLETRLSKNIRPNYNDIF